MDTTCRLQALEAACAYAATTRAVFDQMEMDAVRDVRNNQHNGVPPSEGDVALALACMNRLVPQLMGLLQPILSKK